MATQISQSQRQLGWSSSVHTLTSTNLHDQPWRLPIHSVAAAIDNFALRHSTFPGLISLARDGITRPLPTEATQADVIHLHWVNGVIDLRSLQRQAPRAKFVWTLHDMNPFTGACHQSFGCEQFTQGCHSCPAVRPFARGLVSQHLEDKKTSLRVLGDVIVVSPSTWLAEQARRSEMFAQSQIHVIANPVRASFFTSEPGPTLRKKISDEKPGKYFCIVAENLADPLKNVESALRAFGRLVENQQNPVELRLIGNNGESFANAKGVRVLGSLPEAQLRHELEGAIALVVPSLAENAPVSIAEAAVLGVPTIGSNIPALRSMLKNMGDSEIVESEDDMTRVMERLLLAAGSASSARLKASLINTAQERFEPSRVAAQYLKLYEGIV